MNGTGTLYYTVTDHLGSIVQLIDENGNVIEETKYGQCSMNFVFNELANTNTLNELIPAFCREGRYCYSDYTSFTLGYAFY